MSITLTYSGDRSELKRAVDLAAGMLKSDTLLQIIRSRKTPFDDSKPKSLSPEKVADYFRDTNLALTVKTYTNSDPDIGGMFDGNEPTVINANVNNLPQRSDCSTAAMLVHECVHALS